MIKTIELTVTQVAIYDAGDDATADDMMAWVRYRAQALANKSRCTVNIEHPLFTVDQIHPR